MRLCIVGHPVSHSLSPKIYTRYFKLQNIGATYEAIDIEPDEFSIKILTVLEKYDGFNITIPFKEKLTGLVESRVEKALGAINCVFQGKGYNTDWIGFSAPLLTSGVEEPVTVIGAGGAARAAVYGLKKLGVGRVNLVNRSSERGKKVKEDFEEPGVFRVEVYPFDSLKSLVRISKSLINATPIGMKGESLDICSDDLAGTNLVYDLIYWETPLLKLALDRGVKKVLGGKGMLLHQAQENLRIWRLSNEILFEKVFWEVTG